MLQLASVHLADPGILYGSALSGDASVQELQKAMVGLAQAASWPAANPGKPDGVMGAATIRALAAAIGGILTETGIGSSEATLIKGALAIALTNDTAMAQAIQYAKQYASQLTAGVKALTLKYMGKAPAAPKPPTTPAGKGPAAPGTYQQLMIQRTSTAAGAGALKAKYPAGSITTRVGNKWRVAVPMAVAKQLGSPGGLGATHKELPSVGFQPAGATVVNATTFDKAVAAVWYKNWKTYAIGGGIAVVLVGGYFLLR